MIVVKIARKRQITCREERRPTREWQENAKSRVEWEECRHEAFLARLWKTVQKKLSIAKNIKKCLKKMKVAMEKARKMQFHSQNHGNNDKKDENGYGKCSIMGFP